MANPPNSGTRLLPAAVTATLIVVGCVAVFLANASTEQVESPSVVVHHVNEQASHEQVASLDLADERRDRTEKSSVAVENEAVPSALMLCLEAGTQQPIRGRDVQVTLRSDGHSETHARRTDSTGHLRLEAPAREAYSLTIHVADHLPLTRTLHIGEASTEATVLFLERAHRITGRVQTTDGTGVSGAEIRAVLVGGDRVQSRRARADQEGQFVLAGLAHGRYRIHAGAPDYLSETLEHDVPSDRQVQLTLPQDSGFAIRVYDDAGRPVEGARLRLLSRTGGIRIGRRSAVTNSDGRATLRGVPPTGPDVPLQIAHQDYSARRFLLSESARVERRVELTLDAPGEILGTVADPNGTPIARAAVHLASADTPFRRTLHSVSSGEFHFRNVPAGKYRLRASVRDTTTSTNISVQSGESHSAQLTLTPLPTFAPVPTAPARRGTLRGRIETTASVAGATLRMERERPDGTAVSRVYRFSSDDLEFRIRGLEPGDYTVWLERRGDVLAELPDVAVLPGEDNAPIVLRLE